MQRGIDKTMKQDRSNEPNIKYKVAKQHNQGIAYTYILSFSKTQLLLKYNDHSQSGLYIKHKENV